MILLVGLGNPGKEYAQTRHNAGFMAVDEIIHRYPFSAFKSKFQGQIAEGVIAGEKVMVLKPETYMNLSGNAVLSICKFYKIPIQNVIVFHDDMDLPVGKVRVKRAGGSGGHNGLKSIDSTLGNNYLRVRIGVSKPERKEEVINWVLSNFSKADKDLIDQTTFYISKWVELLVKNDTENFMNKLVLEQKG